MQKRLQAASLEKDKAVSARNDLERDYHLEKQTHLRLVERKEDELSMLKENNQVRLEGGKDSPISSGKPLYTSY